MSEKPLWGVEGSEVSHAGRSGSGSSTTDASDLRNRWDGNGGSTILYVHIYIFMCRYVDM